MHCMDFERRQLAVSIAFLTACLVSVPAASATPIPSPLVIDLVDPVQVGDPGDVLTFSGLVTNLTDSVLYTDGWGVSLARTVSGYPIRLNFTQEWYAWVAGFVRPRETSGLMPLFTAAIADDFLEWFRSTGEFAIAAYPVGTPVYNPDGTLTYSNATAAFRVTIQQPFAEPIPEPSTLLLTALGGLWMYRHRPRTRSSRMPDRSEVR